MLIGLNGRLQVGKDTTFEIISEFVPHAQRLAFADKLKESAAASLNVAPSMMDQIKTTGIIRVSTINGFISELSGREYLQRYGTESHRDVFGEDFWVDAVLPPTFDHRNKFIVVTDMRFPNEAMRVKQLGGITVRVERGEDTTDQHPSEQNIDWMMDYFLDNHGSMKDLRRNVYRMLQDFGVQDTEMDMRGFIALQRGSYASSS